MIIPFDNPLQSLTNWYKMEFVQIIQKECCIAGQKIQGENFVHSHILQMFLNGSSIDGGWPKRIPVSGITFGAEKSDFRGECSLS